MGEKVQRSIGICGIKFVACMYMFPLLFDVPLEAPVSITTISFDSLILVCDYAGGCVG